MSVGGDGDTGPWLGGDVTVRMTVAVTVAVTAMQTGDRVGAGSGDASSSQLCRCPPGPGLDFRWGMA